MTESTSQTVEELLERVARLNERVSDLAEAYDLDEKEEVEVPAAGRSNWEANRSESVEVEEPETEPYEYEVPTAGRTNERSTTVDSRDTSREADAEDVLNSVTPAMMTFSDEEEIDEDDVPAGGKVNWERHQESDD